ncbi:hypothetical protein T459_26600 [Capsicum annuum]|uniref:NAC domain-containing protein n=1 Tax=Capsicum annuum TaxID=4072 RepID=A0A2G2YP21_CAPAN|nr:hypothetical protein FXO37_00051 [Capsicum annuum]PHT71496.1 hypothetical protein T459_26600 [Capsicum annuum]
MITLWKGIDREKSVYDGPKIVGSKKNYRYQYKGYQADDVVWTMREYSLDEKILKALRRRCLIKYEDVVLSCVKRRINVRARDHKELGDCMPMGITSGDEFVAAMDAMPPTTQQHDSCLLNGFTSSEHNNVFHELQQDQNSEQLINQVQTIDELVSSARNHNGYVESYIEQGTSNFQDSCPVYPFTSSEHNAFQLEQYQNIEQNDIGTQPQLPIGTNVHARDHKELGDYTPMEITSGDEVQTLDEIVSSAQYHNDSVTSYSEKGATNFQDYNVDCYNYTGSDFSSTLADLLNDIGTQPQFPPICIDESGYDYQLPQQIITCPMAQQSTDFSSQSELYDLSENIF